MASFDEELLLISVSQGNRESFSEIYNMYFSDIHKYVFKFVKTEDYTDDLCQEIFMKVWENREKLPKILHFRAYIFTIAKNHVYDFLRYTSRDEQVRVQIQNGIRRTENSIEDTFQAEEYLRHVQAVLDSMGRSQEIFTLCREMNQTYDQAAETLGISRNAVKRHMVKTMKYLKHSARKNFGLSFN